MKNWLEQQISSEKKKPLPILAFPAVQYLNITVRELVADAESRAIGMRLIADKFDMPAALGYMDLSVEAEAFGAETVYSDAEIPTIIGQLLKTEEDVDELTVPEIGTGRTGSSIDVVKRALTMIKDRPVFGQCIGPFSLAGRLMNVNEIMVLCLSEPELVGKVLRKATDFLLKYAQEYKKAGAQGLVIAEPLAGILGPELIEEFSSDYVRELIAAVQDDHFVVIYHNCGNAVPFLLDSITSLGCSALHFGDSANMREILEKVPGNLLAMGNVSPSKIFKSGTVEQVRQETHRLLTECGGFRNFVISSGCDIPPMTPLANVEAFFETVERFYN